MGIFRKSENGFLQKSRRIVLECVTFLKNFDVTDAINSGKVNDADTLFQEFRSIFKACLVWNRKENHITFRKIRIMPAENEGRFRKKRKCFMDSLMLKFCTGRYPDFSFRMSCQPLEQFLPGKTGSTKDSNLNHQPRTC